MKKILLIATSFALLTACSKNSKKALGLTETMTDEYQVQRNKSLEIPPHYRLKAPAKKDVKKNTLSNSKLSKAEKALLKEVE